jgi:hypothetical protein
MSGTRNGNNNGGLLRNANNTIKRYMYPLFIPNDRNNNLDPAINKWNLENIISFYFAVVCLVLVFFHFSGLYLGETTREIPFYYELLIVPDIIIYKTANLILDLMERIFGIEPFKKFTKQYLKEILKDKDIIKFINYKTSYMFNNIIYTIRLMVCLINLIIAFIADIIEDIVFEALLIPLPEDYSEDLIDKIPFSMTNYVICHIKNIKNELYNNISLENKQ